MSSEESTIISHNYLPLAGSYGIPAAMKKWLLTHELCDFLNITKNTAFSWGESGKIKMRREGPLKIRQFDYEDAVRLKKSLPKKRGPSIRIFGEKKKK